MSDTPKVLDAITDAVLAYKPKTKAQRKRARKVKKEKGRG